MYGLRVHEIIDSSVAHSAAHIPYRMILGRKTHVSGDSNETCDGDDDDDDASKEMWDMAERLHCSNQKA